MNLRLRAISGAGLLWMLLFAQAASGKLVTARYGVSLDARGMESRLANSMDSLIRSNPALSQKTIINNILYPRVFNDKTTDFYLLIFLVLMLGFIRLTDPKYFQNLWQAFKHPTLSSRQLKDKLQSATVSNLLMNVFFTISIGSYVFYVVQNFTPHRTGNIPPSLLIIMLIAGIMLIYLGKYFVIKFSGWAFRVEGVTEQYLFNIFLINKVLAIILVPFIVLMAFAEKQWAQPALMISLILIIVLFISRYMRSWQVFGSFFQYSKFHFFTYLCASELLPLAVLTKLLVRGLLY